MTRINVGIAPTNLPDELRKDEEDEWRPGVKDNKPKSEGIQEKVLALLWETNY